jgi:hypothetical protein
MNSRFKTVAGALALTVGSISVEAADYTDTSNEELVQMRSQVREMAPEDRESYRTEMQTRTQSMSGDEKALYRRLNESGGQGKGAGKMNRYGQGNNNGSGNRNRYGQGNSNGSGSMNRYGQIDSQGHGSGYGSRQGGGNGSGNGGGKRNR